MYESPFAIAQPLLHQATSSIAQVEEWITKYPDCRWAVATGAESGVFAAEFSRDRGIQTMRSQCAGDFTAMDTLQIRTAERVTMFFRWPDAGLPVSRRNQIAEGISIRHSGGFADLPIETERSSGDFRYSNLDAPTEDAPAWLLSLIVRSFSKHRVADVIPFPPCKTRSRLVALSFELKNKHWTCHFFSMEEGAIIKTLTFCSARTIVTLAERGGVVMNVENRAWLNSSLRNGKGNLLLTLTTQQYKKLLAA